MNALPLLSELAGRGVHIRVDGCHLVVSQDRLTDSLETSIRENKPALIASLTQLRQYADGEADWQEVVSHPEQLQSMIYSLVTTEARERGEIPAHYTATTNCRRCGTVPTFDGCPPEVRGCPWCMGVQSVPNQE